MNDFIRRQHRTHCAALSLFLVTFLCGPPTAFAEEPSPPTPSSQETVAPSTESVSPPEAGDVQERAVPRDHRTKPRTFTPAQKAPPPLARPTPQGKVLIPQAAPATGTGGPSSVVGGVLEPDYRYPWVVRMGGCGGVLIDPQWVLTAAHCVTPGIGFGKLTYSRTDPYTGSVKTETRAPFPEQRPNPGVYIHPNYAPNPDHANDIALIKLEKPFTSNPYIQTVGLPRDFRHSGMVATLASIDHTAPLPPGQLATFRAPIPQMDYPPKIYITAMAANASLCKGDSGSGIVTVENGRATVRGIASQGSLSSCTTPSGEAVFTDVFAFRGWILQTMSKNDASLSGNTRLRWSGRGARGVMIVACFNPYGNLEGPLNVVGVEEGALCEPGQTQTVMCNLNSNQGNVNPAQVPMLSGLVMRTTIAGGGTDVKTIPPSSSGKTVSFFGPLPAGASREFTCQIGSPLVSGAVTGGNMAVLSRGLEGDELSGEIVEQPSPFDQPEDKKP